MYRIGDFSKITELTVKALRYYDEEGILKPSYRDGENGYRFYNEEDFKRAQFIVLLRRLDFSISEIRDVVCNCENESDLSYFLKEKQAMIRERIENEKMLIKKIGSYISPQKGKDDCMNYEIQIKRIEPVMVAAIRYKGKYCDVGKYIGKVFKAVKGKASGVPFNCYYDSEYKEEDADIEICVPISSRVSSSDIIIKELPEVRVICTTHIGSYEKLNMAYKAIFDYAEKNKLICKTPSREIYVKGPGMIFKGNPDKYNTQIIVPFEERKIVESIKEENYGE